MSQLKVGIVGLPNVGKSTLFNAVLRRAQALAENYPFATIDPNIGVVEVVDNRVDKLAEISKSEKKIYSTVEFVDIAGLVEGAHKGEGLGNRFLSHIREVDLILLVLRGFEDESIVREGSKTPDHDREVVLTELALKDLETAAKAYESRRKNSETRDEADLLAKIIKALENGELVSAFEPKLRDKDREFIGQFQFLTAKPIINVLNVSEDSVLESGDFGFEYLPISAKMESELSVLSEKDQKEFLKTYGLTEPPLNRVIKVAYDTLGLISFLTTGPKESRAWAIKKGTLAPKSAGVIHSDFEKNFIKAKVTAFEDFVEFGGWQGVKEEGKLRTEGKEYVVKDGDVVEFMVG